MGVRGNRSVDRYFNNRHGLVYRFYQNGKLISTETVLDNRQWGDRLAERWLAREDAKTLFRWSYPE
jgi:hypothetical protein